jgi:hypothetical protein
MSTATGTATDYRDLLNKLITFLTTDATLTGLGQNWTLLASSSASYAHVDGGATNTVEFEAYLKAPGLSTAEQIFVELQAYQNGGAGYYNWRMRGAAGYSAASDWFSQPGASPSVFLYLWDAAIPYWFIANGQRVIVVAQVGTVFEHGYLGKFLPDGTPGQYPYPMFVGGTGGDSTAIGAPVGNDNLAPNRLYSDVTDYHASFWDPACAFHCDVSGAWVAWAHYSTGNDIHTNDAVNHIWPYADGNSGYIYPGGMTWMIQNLDGGYPLLPTRLEQITPSINLLGTLDGVFATTGEGNSSTSTVTVGGATYLCFQDTYRTGRANFIAYLDA